MTTTLGSVDNPSRCYDYSDNINVDADDLCRGSRSKGDGEEYVVDADK
jgi:hypothetical protein